MKEYAVGDRVRVSGHWEWPDGLTGTVAAPVPFLMSLAEPGEWQGHRLTTGGRRGPIVCYYVEFDRAADDGSGDGPYRGGVIEADCLAPLDA